MVPSWSVVPIDSARSGTMEEKCEQTSEDEPEIDIAKLKRLDGEQELDMDEEDGLEDAEQQETGTQQKRLYQMK